MARPPLPGARPPSMYPPQMQPTAHPSIHYGTGPPAHPAMSGQPFYPGTLPPSSPYRLASMGGPGPSSSTFVPLQHHTPMGRIQTVSNHSGSRSIDNLAELNPSAQTDDPSIHEESFSSHMRSRSHMKMGSVSGMPTALGGRGGHTGTTPSNSLPLLRPSTPQQAHQRSLSGDPNYLLPQTTGRTSGSPQVQPYPSQGNDGAMPFKVESTLQAPGQGPHPGYPQMHPHGPPYHARPTPYQSTAPSMAAPQPQHAMPSGAFTGQGTPAGMVKPAPSQTKPSVTKPAATASPRPHTTPLQTSSKDKGTIPPNSIRPLDGSGPGTDLRPPPTGPPNALGLTALSHGLPPGPLDSRHQRPHFQVNPSRTSIHDLIASLFGSDVKLDPRVEAWLLSLADRFIDQVAYASCLAAASKGSSSVPRKGGPSLGQTLASARAGGCAGKRKKSLAQLHSEEDMLLEPEDELDSESPLDPLEASFEPSFISSHPVDLSNDGEPDHGGSTGFAKGRSSSSQAPPQSPSVSLSDVAFVLDHHWGIYLPPPTSLGTNVAPSLASPTSSIFTYPAEVPKHPSSQSGATDPSSQKSSSLPSTGGQPQTSSSFRRRPMPTFPIKPFRYGRIHKRAFNTSLHSGSPPTPWNSHVLTGSSLSSSKWVTPPGTASSGLPAPKSTPRKSSKKTGAAGPPRSKLSTTVLALSNEPEDIHPSDPELIEDEEATLPESLEEREDPTLSRSALLSSTALLVSPYSLAKS